MREAPGSPSPARPERLPRGGPISWMARHSVAPNLLMLLLVLGGLLFSTRITQEVLPRAELEAISVKVALPGATPGEVERGIVLAIEERLQSIAGIRAVNSTAAEGLATVTAEIEAGEDRIAAYNAIQQEIARITTFPEDAEEPTVTLHAFERDVVMLQIYGDVDQRSLRMAAEHLRGELLAHDGISRVRIEDEQAMEIAIEIPRAQLRAYGLTLGEIADTVRRAALDRGGGTIEARSGDILLRVAERRETLDEFARIPVLADATGTVLRLGDIATLTEGFADSGTRRTFNGKPAIALQIYRTGAETPIGVSDAAREVLPAALSTLPAAVDIAVVGDQSEVYRDRMELLIRNGFIGLCLVLVLLSLFLEFRLAFWVAVGIPTAFLGTMLFLPQFGASINMVSMFAFILALGIVVDDAIVVGENIYEYLERGLAPVEAAVQGARDIAVPLTFSILTNVIAFLPLAMVPGWFGKFWIVIPIVVATAFLLSWIEALFVLPGHLAASGGLRRDRRPGPLARVQRAMSAGLARAIERLYGPLLALSMRWRYTTVAVMVLILALTLAWPLSGRMGFSLFPPIPRDIVSAQVTLPVDAPAAVAGQVADRVTAAAWEVIRENGGEAAAEGVAAKIDTRDLRFWVHLAPPASRTMEADEFTRAWRERVGDIPEARSSTFSSSFGGPAGDASLSLALSHRDTATLDRATALLAVRLAEYDTVRDVSVANAEGKTELAFRITEAGRALGLTAADVAAQVRAAFFGVEALRQQEGRNEVTVRVRLPEAERRSEFDVESLILRTPAGGEVLLYEIAEVERGRAAARISREDGLRTVRMTANVDPPEQVNLVVSALREEILPALARDVPGLGWRFRGAQESQREAMESFKVSVTLALLLIYAALAIPFRSWVQPLIVMAAIPFGFSGAIMGHMIMGMSLSIISVFGVIALGGVVINAALVMIDYANKARAAGAEPFEAIWRAGVRRFRPILLTTLTTFGGLAPMIFETSRQAQYLIPMAVSLGYGIVFATAIVLLLIPSLYLIVEDIRWLLNPRPPEPAAGARQKPERTPIAAE